MDFRNFRFTGILKKMFLTSTSVPTGHPTSDRLLRFFGFFGDIDYGMRAHLAGFKLVCAKGAWLYHEGSGHVKREMEKMGASWEARQAERMKLVDEAYQVFRKKWNLQHPVSYTGVRSIRYFEIARSNMGKVPLKYEMPPATMSDLEFH